MSIFAPQKTEQYSVVDPVQEELDEEIIQNNKLVQSLRRKIISAVSHISKKMDINIKRIYLVGSSLTFQYRPDSDIDVTLFVESSKEDLKDINKILEDSFNEKLFLHKHPINFHFNSGKYDKFKADAIYDVLGDKWIKQPEPLSDSDVEEMIHDCQSAKEFNEIMREYADLKHMLKSYSGDPDSLEEILDQAFKVSILFSKIRDIRREEFNKRKDKNIPSANFRCSNIIFKLLEQHGLNDLAKQISVFLQSRAKN